MKEILRRVCRLEDHIQPADSRPVMFLRVISLADGRVITRIPMDCGPAPDTRGWRTGPRRWRQAESGGQEAQR
jgi:hypothetical protein